MVAMEGAPGTTVPTPTVEPSSVIVTVPVGWVAEGLDEVMKAVTSMDPPAVGVRVDGVSVIAEGLLETLRETAGAVVVP